MAKSRSKPKKERREEDDTEIIIVTSDMSRVSYAEVRKLMRGKPFDMKLNHTDAKHVQLAVNQGIDAYLQACYIKDRGDSYECKGDNKLHCVVSEESLPVLLRRLYAIDDPEAISIADGILYVLQHPSD